MIANITSKATRAFTAGGKAVLFTEKLVKEKPVVTKLPKEEFHELLKNPLFKQFCKAYLTVEWSGAKAPAKPAGEKKDK